MLAFIPRNSIHANLNLPPGLYFFGKLIEQPMAATQRNVSANKTYDTASIQARFIGNVRRIWKENIHYKSRILFYNFLPVNPNTECEKFVDRFKVEFGNHSFCGSVVGRCIKKIERLFVNNL